MLIFKISQVFMKYFINTDDFSMDIIRSKHHFLCHTFLRFNIDPFISQTKLINSVQISFKYMLSFIQVQIILINFFYYFVFCFLFDITDENDLFEIFILLPSRSFVDQRRQHAIHSPKLIQNKAIIFHIF